MPELHIVENACAWPRHNQFEVTKGSACRAGTLNRTKTTTQWYRTDHLSHSHSIHFDAFKKWMLGLCLSLSPLKLGSGAIMRNQSHFSVMKEVRLILHGRKRPPTRNSLSFESGERGIPNPRASCGTHHSCKSHLARSLDLRGVHWPIMT